MTLPIAFLQERAVAAVAAGVYYSQESGYGRPIQSRHLQSSSRCQEYHHKEERRGLLGMAQQLKIQVQFRIFDFEPGTSGLEPPAPSSQWLYVLCNKSVVLASYTG